MVSLDVSSTFSAVFHAPKFVVVVIAREDMGALRRFCRVLTGYTWMYWNRIHAAKQHPSSQFLKNSAGADYSMKLSGKMTVEEEADVFTGTG